MASFVLNGFTLATDGVLAPVASGRLCLQGFALASGGQFTIEALAGIGKLADPAARYTHQIIEPWDDRYYRFKYGKSRPKPDKVLTPKPQEPPRPSVMPELLARDLEATRLENAEIAALRELRAKKDQTDRDILELQAYIAEVTRGIEEGIAQELVAKELELANQEAVMARLAENMAAARESLLVALEARRRHQNRIAAIEAVIRIYY